MTTTTTTHIQETLQNVYEKYKDVRDGEVASYIPELAKAKPDDFGISLATVDGQVFSVGDFQQEFTIQSICKPFAFLMALEEFGRDAVLQKVCVEPSGDAFNSIELEPKTMRPFNPMINAGAIAIASLIKKSSRDCGVRTLCGQDGTGGGPEAGYRSSGARVRDRNGESQSGDRVSDAELRHYRCCRGSCAAPVFRAVLAQGELSGSGDDVGDAGEHGDQSRSPSSRYSDWSTSRTCWR